MFLPNRPQSVTVKWLSSGCDLQGCLINMWSFSCQFVFNQIWTMEADNEIPESHPESSSAFGWTFYLSVVLCNLLPESYAGYQEAAAASSLNVPLCAVSSAVSEEITSLQKIPRCLQRSTNHEEAKESKHGFSQRSRRSILYLCHNLLMHPGKSLILISACKR